ncbi:hypothetical protein NSK_005416 [Nannochloropsis salina CCMP1776]|uniref:Uncharacterized protein n=1 Tax=Nannochloropsis salina CCMP1776 TaxID=1027361 RepID=A0A4D9CXQ3_9STRA|nr:hypothetical protein NSK_005416 [Nannochloropsis salina CCMP1776]|eukprot:TFJ83254.1 hypothetical protein NSK_005416 [Nannochloropsis salina CCMP1776]
MQLKTAAGSAESLNVGSNGDNLQGGWQRVSKAAAAAAAAVSGDSPVSMMESMSMAPRPPSLPLSLPPASLPVGQSDMKEERPAQQSQPASVLMAAAKAYPEPPRANGRHPTDPIYHHGRHHPPPPAGTSPPPPMDLLQLGSTPPPVPAKLLHPFDPLFLPPSLPPSLPTTSIPSQPPLALTASVPPLAAHVSRPMPQNPSSFPPSLPPSLPADLSHMGRGMIPPMQPRTIIPAALDGGWGNGEPSSAFDFIGRGRGGGGGGGETKGGEEAFSFVKAAMDRSRSGGMDG